MCIEEDNQAADRGLPDRHEAARLVQLCADQIRAALDEAGDEISALSLSVLNAARCANELADQAARDKPAGQFPAGAHGGGSDSLRQAAADASSRLQFADRLSQRISNATANLAALAQLMNSFDGSIASESWSDFLCEVRGRFTMEQERLMFDAIFETPAIGTRGGIKTVGSDDEVFS